jgi:ABC-type lipoprotein release transport system permease subunit
MIAVSMSTMIGIEGLYDGMADNMIDKNRRSGSGDISIFHKGYRTQRDLSHTLHNTTRISNEIATLEGVDAVVQRISADGLVATPYKSSFATLYGIDLNKENLFGNFNSFLKQGAMQLNHHGSVIGLELAKKLKLHIGSKIIFSTQDIHGEITTISLRITGIIQTTNVVLDTSAIYFNIHDVHTFLGTDPDDATQIAVMSTNPTLYSLLKKRYKTLDIKSFLELQPTMKMMQTLMNIFNSVTFFIVMGVVFIGIFGVMYVSILDRVREFGIALAIGMHYHYIRLQIILEALFISLTGYILGSVLGLILLMYLQYYGLDLSAFSDALEKWGYEAIIYGTVKLSYFTTTFMAIISAALLSVILPLQKIRQLNPIDVIKAQK